MLVAYALADDAFVVAVVVVVGDDNAFVAKNENKFAFNFACYCIT